MIREVPFLPRRVAYMPHHVYMAALAENGIPGLIIYSSIHLAVILQLLFCIQRARDREAKLLAVGLLSAFAGFIFCINFYYLWGSKYAWAIMALGAALSQVLKNESEFSNSESDVEPEDHLLPS